MFLGRGEGRGLEYLWSREYQVRDDISFIDWKATARHQKIFVKEFLEEAYGSAKVIYDICAHGPLQVTSAQHIFFLLWFSPRGLDYR